LGRAGRARSLADEDIIRLILDGTVMELCLNLGDAHHEAARFSVSLVTSTASLNLSPSMTFGN
jgi:hypothetical protein